MSKELKKVDPRDCVDWNLLSRPYHLVSRLDENWHRFTYDTYSPIKNELLQKLK